MIELDQLSHMSTPPPHGNKSCDPSLPAVTPSHARALLETAGVHAGVLKYLTQDEAGRLTQKAIETVLERERQASEQALTAMRLREEARLARLLTALTEQSIQLNENLTRAERSDDDKRGGACDDDLRSERPTAVHDEIFSFGFFEEGGLRIATDSTHLLSSSANANAATEALESLSLELLTRSPKIEIRPAVRVVGFGLPGGQ